MIARRSQTVKVYKAAENLNAAKVVTVPQFAQGVEVRCQITPAAKGVTYTRTGLDLNNPHVLFADLSDADLFSVGSYVLFGSRWFKVAAPVEKFEVGLPADHAKSLLEELSFAPEVGA